LELATKVDCRRIAELETLELATERALSGHAGGNDIREAVLHLRELLSRAELMLQWEQPDYADMASERAERELITLRGIARQVGVLRWGHASACARRWPIA
jgi:hypothetical protein